MRFRIAPSPTGSLHLGSVLTVVANLAAARSAGGELILRIDDTDLERSTYAFAEELLADLAWLGIDTTSPVRQRERVGIHAQAAQALADAGRAYPCFCTPAELEARAAAQRRAGQPPRYDGACRDIPAGEAAERIAAGEPCAVRLRIDEMRATTLDDLVRGPVEFGAGSFGDFVIVRSDGSPVYLLASIVDDLSMGIDVVLRGEDHLANTPRQLRIAEALAAAGWKPDAKPPRFGHLPLLRDAAGQKLSKRSGSTYTVAGIRAAGHEPAAVRAWAMELLGHGAADPIESPVGGGWFDWGKIPVAAPRADIERLAAIGRDRTAATPLDWLVAEVRGAVSEPAAGDLAPLVENLAAEHHGVVPLAGAVASILAAPALADRGAFAAPDADWALARADELLDEAGADPPMVIAALKRAASERGIGAGAVLKPVRYALTGQRRGPQLDAVLSAIGAVEAKRRLQAARAASTQGVE